MKNLLFSITRLIIAVAAILAAGEATSQCKFKNVILMIGDGMGYNQIAAANFWQGDREQVYQRFPVKLATTTFMYEGSYFPDSAWMSFDYLMRGYTDSAPAASSMATGKKLRNGQLNMDPVSGEPLYTIQQRFEELGRSTGVVTTVQWSHATPAAFGAHNSSRKNYEEIAQEMIDRSGLDVIMGCGHPLYNDNGQPDTVDYRYVGGKTQWDSLVAGLTSYHLIQTREQFRAVAAGEAAKMVCGTAQCRSTLQQARRTLKGEGPNEDAPPYSAPLNTSVPSLAEMTAAALKVLSANSSGFFLMIEGGAIDWACHDQQKGRLIEEQIDFNRAVEDVVAWVEANSNWDETLLIVTADHETGFLLGTGSQPPATFKPLQDNGAGRLPGMTFFSDKHTNSLVPLFAKGSGAEQFVVLAAETDPVRGPYCDLTHIGKVVFRCLE